MIAKATKLSGAYIIEPEEFEDERGFFARLWSEEEFQALGVEGHFIESNMSYNKTAGTLRGMHYQGAPFAQGKLVRCTQGAIYDVGVDLRRDSDTFGQWIGIELSAANRRMLYVPVDFGHGYLSLTDNTEVHYQVTAPYAPESAGGFRWNDPAFNIEWPLDTLNINERDREFPDYKIA